MCVEASAYWSRACVTHFGCKEEIYEFFTETVYSLPSHLKSTMDVGIPKLRTLMYDAPWVPWTTGMTLQCSNSTRKSMTYQSMTRHNNTNNAKTLRSSNSTRKCKTFQNITNQIYKERMCYTKKYDEPNMVWTDVLHQKIRRTKYSMNRCAAPKNMTNQI